MCGIAGYCLKNKILPSSAVIDSFLNALRRRGPDDEGISLISRSTNQNQTYRGDRTYSALNNRMPHIHQAQDMHDVALIQTRYAILDLSEKGHQPFTSADGSIVGIFNGEIYNFIELREELSSLGVRFHTNCDTEVLVEGYARWKDDLWSKMNGFWAVVLYDFKNHLLIFSRDRMGVAPLYYRQTVQGTYFSSYIEALIDIEGQKTEPNEDAVLGFAQTGFKDLDYTTFYSDIKSVPAASVLHLKLGQSLLSEAFIKRYWSLPPQRLKEKDISLVQAIEEFRKLFFNAVDIRLRADVKIAFELSGGLDSSSIVAAAMLHKNKITTYTAKIQGADEEPFARCMLKKYALDYQVIARMEDNFINDYASFTKLMEEPYDNPNAYTHYQMLRVMKSQGVNVVITGAGGDEVLAGYEASFWPKAYREWKAQGLASYLKAEWYEACRRFKTWKRASGTVQNYFVSPWKRWAAKEEVTKQPWEDIPTTALQYRNQYNQLSFEGQRKFHFSTALLPFYMRSSDHFTMGVPVEHRFPLLDYRLVEFGLRLPISYLFRNGWTKYILRKAMEPYLPAKIVWRRQKMGFQFPYGSYFKQNAQTFNPLLKECYRAFPQLRSSGEYNHLLKNDPVLLWRLISIGIWEKVNV
jgi:asparagine synthase (glutamine-hydrolysing)